LIEVTGEVVLVGFVAVLSTFHAGLAGFYQKVEKTFFSMVKTGLAKILFAGKNRLSSK